ncbi:MAG: hypothetical protein WA461_00190 [Nitrososphaeraceae archaeon]
MTQTLMSKGFIRIHPLLEELTMSLRTAKVRDDVKLDKKQTTNDDIMNAFRLACLNY